MLAAYKYSKYIDPYINAITNNEIIHCKEQDLMIKNIVIPVLEREDTYIDHEAIEKGLSLQKYFPFNLLMWEVFLFSLIVGLKYTNGKIFFKETWIMVGRGSGKNGFIAFLCFYFLSPYHGIKNYNIDLLANTEEQAMRSFKDVYEVVKHPDNKEYIHTLNANYTARATVITGKHTRSELLYNTSSSRGKDSKRTGCVVFDEKHEYMDTRNINTLTSGLGKIKNPRIITISTDGNVRGGVIDKEKEQNKARLSKYNPKNRTLVFWCKIEKESEWNNLDMLIKAIPSLNDFDDLKDTIADEIEDMANTPEYYLEYMAKRCNFPIQSSASAVANDEDLNAACNQDMIDLSGMSCVGGLDYSSTNDFTSCLLLFKKEGKTYIKQHTFVCTRSRDLKGIKAPLDEWKAMGELEYVDDVEIPAKLIVDWFVEQSKIYNIKEIAIDNYRYSYVQYEFKKAGFDVTENKNLYRLKRGDNAKVYPLINSLFINQNIIWGKSPSMMKWYTNNVKVESNGTSLYFSKQEPHYRKTDGFMAFVAAMAIQEKLDEETNQFWALPILTF